MRWSWPGRVLAPALDALAEGSLLWVLYGAFAASSSSSQPPLGLVEFGLAAALGVALSRRLASPATRRLALVVGAICAGCVGWLADPSAGTTLVRDGLAPALAVGAPGWLLAVTVLRGAAHRDPAADGSVASQVLAVGVPGLALPWLTHIGARPGDAFVGPALAGSLLFVTSSLLAIAHGRLSALGLDPQQSEGGRAWAGVAVGVVVLMGLTALAATLVLGAPLTVLLSVVGGSLLAGVAHGIAGLMSVLSPVGAALGGLLDRVSGLPGPGRAPIIAPPAQPTPGPGAAGVPPIVGPLLAIAALTAVGLAIRYRHVFRAPRAVPPLRASQEMRIFVVPHVSFALRRPRLRASLPQRRRSPADAVEAYLRLLRELDGRPELARSDAESPASHAHRIGGCGLPAAPLAMLVADFELAAYGDRALGRRETVRAVARWRRLRRAIRARYTPGHTEP